MPRLLRYCTVLILLSFSTTNATSAPARPVVAGYERFHAEKPDAKGGQLLLGELGCVRCHDAPNKDASRPGPVLDGVGGRVRVSWLRKYLTDPHATKPGASMPHLLGDDKDKVEALVHLLASTGTLRHERVTAKSIDPGRQTYERSGCVACHGTRKNDGSEDKRIATQMPLGDLKAKYSITSLSAFLQDPLHVRPGGRMPRLLDAKEAKDVATFLLQGIKVSVLEGKGTAKYAYFEGDWSNMPDFAKLKPKASGTSLGFELDVAKRGSNYAIRYEAVLQFDQDGQYSFTLNSDDGSILWIDDKIVVNNDGIHPPQSKTGRAQLTKGIHKVTLGFFQGGGGAELDAKIVGPGLGDTDLGTLVAASEEELKKRPKPKVESEDAIDIKPELATKGAALFSSLGCASCHQLSHNGQKLTSALKVPELSKVDATKGCLAETPPKSVPLYTLDQGQRKSIALALKQAPDGAKTTEARIADAMLTFNCYACHTRAKIGGPQDEINKTFQTTQPEMGDEGRLPPPLDGVGAKLNPDYMKVIFDKGVHDRPYMHTRMPGFGTANIGILVAFFAETDKLPVIPEVKFTQVSTQIKSAGRRLSGDGMLSCIKCHTFNGQKAEGVQGIDMIKMPQRLRRDWFHAYVNDPQTIRPGTRMPASYVKGKSVLPEILDGTAAQQIEAMWQYLNDGTRARPPLGVGKSYIPLVPKDGAIIYRNFIEGGGTRAIAIGYPEKAHLAFDANDLKISMIWQGLFIDAARHWTDRGSGFEGPLGDNIVKFPSGPTFAILEKADSNWPANAKTAGQQFKGYRLTKDDRPTFLYNVGEVTVEDFPNAIVKDNQPALVRKLQLATNKAPENLCLRAAIGNKIEVEKDGWFKIDDAYRLNLTAPNGKTWIRKSGGKEELMWQAAFKDGKTTVTLEYSW